MNCPNDSKKFKIDMIQANVQYAITINPDNFHQYYTKGDHRLEYVETYLYCYHLSKLSAKFALYPEIKTDDENKKPNRIHFHGYITFSSVFSWYMSQYNKFIKSCQVVIKPIDNKKEWDDYVFKNKEAMKPICQEARLKYKLSDKTKLERLREQIKELNIEKTNTTALDAGTGRRYRRKRG